MSIRLKLFGIWFIGFTVCFTCTLVFAPVGYVLPAEVPQHLTKIAGIYVPYLTPIIAFWYAEDVVGNKRQHTNQAVVVAFATSGFYNFVLILILLSTFLGSDGTAVVDSNIELMGNVGTLLAFIAGPAIGYFFSAVQSTSTS